MKEFQKEDQFGLSTLETISKADKFNHWMFSIIKPFCSGKILEIGSGIGNISQHFIEADMDITLSDVREDYCDALNRKFNKTDKPYDVLQVDIADAEFKMNYKQYRETFNTIFASNVIEHIQDDVRALQNCHFLLKKEGNLIILVPAYQQLYNSFDVALGHYRRYTKNLLSNLLVNTGLDIIHAQYFNFAGILGWFFSGNVLKNKSISAWQMGLYDTLVPIFKLTDKIMLERIGLSVVVVGRK